ncbi:MAG: hypothetical protein WC832_01530 [Anaerolineales bacterium]
MTIKDTKEKVAFILGAGFSKCADLPVQSEFSSLLTSNEFHNPIDVLITKTIKDFLKDVFGWKVMMDLPNLEDIFTFIDLSAGSGHHLGIKYKPNRLRALRRMLIYRTFQIIDHRFKYSVDIERLLRHYQNDDCSFVVMNWDIVLEKHLQSINTNRKINYITPSHDWDNHERGNSEEGIKICKMHGSSNWAYCENCKTLFYLLDEKLSLHKKVGLVKSDFRLFDEKFTDKHFDDSIGLSPSEKQCRICNNSLATHIATFSYRKSFRTAAYPAIWLEAENILANATKWIFVGYSLPEADFEIKHLIKSSELRLKHKKISRDIDVVIYHDTNTKNKFEKFFGVGNVKIFDEGLSNYVSLFKGDIEDATPEHATRIDKNNSVDEV